MKQLRIKFLICAWTFLFGIVLAQINCQGLPMYWAICVNIALLLAYVFCLILTLDDHEWTEKRNIFVYLPKGGESNNSAFFPQSGWDGSIFKNYDPTWVQNRKGGARVMKIILFFMLAMNVLLIFSRSTMGEFYPQIAGFFFLLTLFSALLYKLDCDGESDKE